MNVEGENEEGLLERVEPLEAIEAGEAGEVAIGRAQDEPVLDGKGGDVGIRHEVGPALPRSS